ncbi:MAG: Nif3-like dinuclear metal center hexameric protein [Phycisphaerales bacterium]|nr:Nif3-like dinuclear metal center hexameric protein [Phycisphaerales bacterium]
MAKRTRRIRDLAKALARVAPEALAAPWDNVGLLLGDANSPCDRVLLTIDLTDAVAEEACALRVGAVIAYHPPIFHPIKKLVRQDAATGPLYRLAHAGIAVLSPHTALDAVAGGINDWLAEGIGDGDCRPLEASSSLAARESFKIVTVAPAEVIDRIRGAMSIAGAGRIGEYSQCSQSSAVEGSFYGGAKSSPRVGHRGKLERIQEQRLEMVCGPKALPAALAALRAAHPYETPAIEVHSLVAQPSAREGQGRLLRLSEPASTKEIARRLRKHLGADRLECAAPTAAIEIHHEFIGLCAGSGMSLFDGALRAGATLFFTGEAKHHEQLAVVARGCTLLLSGHTVSERGYLPRLAQKIAPHVPGISFTLSKHDRHPLVEV